MAEKSVYKMNQKQIGAVVIIISVLISGFIYLSKLREDEYVNEIIRQKGNCYLDDGTCLHSRSTLFIVGWIIAGTTGLFGIYLVFFDRTQRVLAEHQAKLATALENASKRDEFNAFLSGFSSEEQQILKELHKQEGIKQSTLRYRLDMSKTTLSLILKSLEERGIITRKPLGKTNQVFLKKRF